jgi:sialate O-acetylesterase
MKLRFIVTLSFFALSSLILANVKLPKVFSDNMVLQRNIETPVWGWADVGEKVTILFHDQKVKTTADKDGKWIVRLEPEKAGGPFSMIIKGKSEITLNNILVGDVWICSGQSNMEWPLWNTNNGADALKEADNQQIRLLFVPHTTSLSPLEDFNGDGWSVSDYETAHDFSAVGYYFGAFLQKELNVPIGLISSNWGGTRVESWTSAESCDKNNFLKEWYDKIKQVDIETLKKQEKEKLIKYNESLDKALGKGGTPHPYIAANYKDDDWKQMTLPGLWEDGGIGPFDGIVWFRKSFILPENFNLKGATLKIGKIDDTDITWMNGTIVGQTYMQYAKLREYPIPEGILKTGKNLITVRVEDYVGGGGIYGNANELVLSDGKIEISLAGSWKYKKEDISIPRSPRNPDANILGPNDYPTLLYNGMINPLVPFGIKGVIWYQGEANADNKIDAIRYRELFPIMINDWRNKWKQEGDFPFLFVQLANYMEPAEEPKDENWAYLRESQTMTSETVPNTGMACIIDIGEANNIHPRNKKDVGYRLALMALKKAYHQEVVYSGPTFEVVTPEGNQALVTFANTGSGLIVKNKYGHVNGFAVAGYDKKFHYARAEITGNNKVTIYAPSGVAEIVAVRYGWANNPDDLNLYNKEGLPAVPFRTDAW